MVYNNKNLTSVCMCIHLFTIYKERKRSYERECESQTFARFFKVVVVQFHHLYVPYLLLDNSLTIDTFFEKET
jgi:hypothetical protein